MRIGVSKADITPPIGIRLGGYAARYKGSEGIHDPLHARALYVEGREESVLLIANDLVNVPNHIVTKVRSEIAGRTKLKGSSIMISATHTHSGPSQEGILISDPAISPSESVSPDSVREYFKTLPEKMVEVAIEARGCAQNAKVGWGTSKASIAFNRREKDGPVDREVSVFIARNGSGRAIGSLVNYACHGVVLGDKNYLISADYPGAVASRIENEFGPGHISLFTNGATGDLNPITSVGYACPGTFEDVEQLGARVADAAINAMKSISVTDDPPVRSVEKRISLSLVMPSEEQARELVRDQEKAISDLRTQNASEEDIKRAESGLSYLKKNLSLIQKGGLEDKTDITLQVLRIGDAALVAIPGEPLVEVGLRIKARSPFKPTLVVAYANGYHGYMPTSESYDRGGYEATPAWWNRLGRGSAETVIEQSLSLIEELR